jgi:hypothetical protein
MDYMERGCDSILAKSARYEGFMFFVYDSWNKDNKYKRRKKMIDAVKIFEPFADKDY